MPVGDLLARVLPAPLVDDVGDVRDLHAEDERRPAASIAFWFASEIIPASATTVTSGRLVGGHELPR